VQLTQAADAIFFCHGAPGSPRDAALLLPITPHIKLIAADLFRAGSGTVLENALQDFDEQTRIFENHKIHITGFSIGAMMAIQIAAARPDRVGQLTLISPAAPLGLGDFLPDMAGKPVFDLAQNALRLLQVLTKIQSLLARYLPHVLINQLFKKSSPREQGLIADPKVQSIIAGGLQNSFQTHPKQYLATLQTYVSDWATDISRVTCPVQVWHGDQDTWAPIAMSHALCAAFPQGAKLHVVKGGEHYSTLAVADLSDA
jgi:pimeloyl-ACP methyl ester carboxylesterase